MDNLIRAGTERRVKAELQHVPKSLSMAREARLGQRMG